MKYANEDMTEKLRGLAERLDQWRQANKGKRIPSELWSEAVELAGIIGASKVSSRLKLWYPRLKAQSEGKKVPKRQKQPPSNLSFMEIPLSPSPVKSPVNEQEPRFLFRLKSGVGTLKVEWV
jgi:hypothetical protein